MPRATDILVVLAYALIAVIAALAFQRFDLMSSQLAWVMGAVVFLIAGQVHSAAARAQENAATSRDIQQLKAANRSLSRALERAESRLDELSPDTASIAPPQLGEAIAAPEVSPETPPAAPAPSAAPASAQTPSEERIIAELLTRLERAGAGPAANAPDERPADPMGADVIRTALDANRVDLYLQPVVGLPQRRTYFYEGFTRLRDGDGEVIPPAKFIKAAEEAGLIAELDNVLLFRCVQIVRRLTKSDRRIGIFCNVSIRALADESFFPDFLDFLRRNSDLAGSLIFEMPQAAFEGRSAIAARNMARLADYGFRFSIDQVANLNLDLAELQRAGVRFAKIEGSRLVAAANGGEAIAGREAGALQPEDVAGLFARYGVDLVAEKIETESTVVEVLDLDIAYAQGHLFGAPRPVREDVIAEADGAQRRAG
ncbi:MAG: EAL domain-containing protein [Pseudomonadota bacterium]